MSEGRPRILFVDDETRVLTAMRAMFRRNYEVHLANSAMDALEVLRNHDIDVAVSDQRMPDMTGVELLSLMRQTSPRVMRILLTGYADLAAIEQAINNSEVFRYLMKPCPRKQLLDVVALAAEASHTAELKAEVSPPAFEPADFLVGTDKRRAPAKASSKANDAAQDNVGFLVLSRDQTFTGDVRAVVQGAGSALYTATTLKAGLDVLRRERIGVVVMDLAINREGVSSLTAELKRQLPELAIIVASDRSDAGLMIELINNSQVFRFLVKPLRVNASRIWLSSAVERHRALLMHPDAARRFSVGGERQLRGEGKGMLDHVVAGIRDLRSRIAGEHRSRNL